MPIPFKTPGLESADMESHALDPEGNQAAGGAPVDDDDMQRMGKAQELKVTSRSTLDDGVPA